MKQDRRNFLKWMGIFANGALLPSCQAKVEKLIPFLNQPEGYVPGEIMRYLTFFANQYDFAELVVSNIDNHPVKLEGNPKSPINQGGLNARIQAALYDFYNGKRFKEPLVDGKQVQWDELDKQVINLFEKSRTNEKEVLLVVPHLISPTEKKVLDEFSSYWGNVRQVVFSPINYTGLAEANKAVSGNRQIPTFAFDQAKCVVGFQCDFLEGWLNGLKNSAQYAQSKKQFGKEFSHRQYESLFSLTGSNATKRFAMDDSKISDLIMGLHARFFNNNYFLKYEDNEKQISDLTAVLKSTAGQNLIVYGGADTSLHHLVLELNAELENFGETVYPDRPDLSHNSLSLKEQHQMILESNPEVVVFYKTNPLNYWTEESELTQKIRLIPHRIGIFDSENEISSVCSIIASSLHHFESWSDAQPEADRVCLGQPVFKSIFNTRAAGESLLRWQNSAVNWYDYLKNNWFEQVLPQSISDKPLESQWTELNETGHVQLQSKNSMQEFELKELIRSYPNITKEENWKLFGYFNTQMGAGEQKNNPWLHELADPVTKIRWANYFTVNPDDLNELVGEERDENQFPILKLSVNGKSIKLPVVAIPGQAQKTVGLALGYGEYQFDEDHFNAFKMLFDQGTWQKSFKIDDLKWNEETVNLGQTQLSNGLPDEYLTAINPEEILDKIDDSTSFEKWLMLVDMDLCTGCSACVVACRAENNIPVVGKDEILKQRDLDWINIERYELEDGQILNLPKMCQQCDNAPCESVCPVLATTHSSDGLSQMVYNRCVGTRYCATNCAYQVRRFNWSNYRKAPYDNLNPGQTSFSKLLLNPQVTVRSRGVMEKCNFCQHRIQAEREKAKEEGRAMKAENTQPACAQTCPSKAIQMVNLNSEEGQKVIADTDKTMFRLLAKYNTEPSVIYISNRLQS